MNKRNILKIIVVTSIVTFTILTHNKAIQHQKELKIQKTINFKYKTDKQKYDEIYKMWIKPSQEKKLIEQKKQEELKRIEEQKKKEESEWINLICTFYTGAEDENGGYQNANKTASGKILSRGMAASNAHKFGTQIYTKEFGVLDIQDRGNDKYIHQVDENTYRIDIYIPDKETANKLGVKKIKGKIVK